MVRQRRWASPAAGRVRSRGVTLIELMVTVAVAAILMAIAAPSFTSLLNNNRLTSAANEMVAAIQSARMEAIRGGSSVTACSSANGESCGGSGMMVVLAADGTILRQAPFDSRVRMDKWEIVFRPDGFARKTDGSLVNNSYSVCVAAGLTAQNVRSITLVAGSRVSTTSTSGACE